MKKLKLKYNNYLKKEIKMDYDKFFDLLETNGFDFVIEEIELFLEILDPDENGKISLFNLINSYENFLSIKSQIVNKHILIL